MVIDPSGMERAVEQGQPRPNRRRADGIVQARSHCLVRVFALEEEDDLVSARKTPLPTKTSRPAGEILRFRRGSPLPSLGLSRARR